MKSRISIVLVTMALVLGTSGILYAQGQINTLFNVAVPFEFRVGSAHLSAGNYTVFHVGSKWILFQSEDRKATALAPVMVSSAPTGRSASRLVFSRYGDMYFLSQVWTEEEDDQMHECHKSTAEQALLAGQRRSGTTTVAAIR